MPPVGTQILKKDFSKEEVFFMKKINTLILLLAATLLLSSCSLTNHGLSAKDPQSITIWHYYNGAIAIQFDELVDEFNSTVGKEKGIVVYAESKSSVGDLTASLYDSAKKKVGAPDMPNIFQCYLDTAVILDEMELLVTLDDYVSAKEKDSYINAYIEEGSFGKDNAWKLFPIAKSTELLMLNKTDWDLFAKAVNVTTEDLKTWEGICAVSEKYYNWSGGKAFFGRDAFANYMIVGSKQLGAEIFEVTDNQVTLHFEKEVMRKLWDNYYIPYIKGYFTQVGKFRSDDIKLGQIIAQVCSTSSAGYFPEKVTKDDETSYPIDYLILPLPNFASTQPYAVRQGANMAITKSTEREEYASIVFLQWFTQKEQNIKFSLSSGYLPVKKDAIELDAIEEYFQENQSNSITKDTVYTALEQIQSSTLFTSGGFSKGGEARDVLTYTMSELAIADREAMDARIENGETKEEVMKTYLSDEHFEAWYEDTLSQLKELCP